MTDTDAQERARELLPSTLFASYAEWGAAVKNVAAALTEAKRQGAEDYRRGLATATRRGQVKEPINPARSHAQVELAANFKRKPVPSLAQWIGDGARAEGFEEWVAESCALEQAVDGSDGVNVRLLRTLSVACVEALRLETSQSTDHVTATLSLARMAGVAIFAAIASGLDADKQPPLLKIARWFTEEFGHGARHCAQSIARHNALSPDA